LFQTIAGCSALISYLEYTSAPLPASTTPVMDRSKSYAGAGRTQIEPYYGGGGVGAGARPDFRSLSYSAGGGGGGAMSSYAYQYEFGAGAEDVNRGSSKSKRGRWLPLGDPDMDRKRRVASYKAYAVEGRVKGSFRKSFKWIKDRYLHLVYGWS
jgi:hypothetical protein